MRYLGFVLLLGACAEPASALPADQLPAVRQSLSAMFAGLSSSLEIRRLPPNATVYVAASGRGLGPGPCPPGYNACVGIRAPYPLFDTYTASASGQVDVNFTVPNLPGQQVCFQAAVEDLSLMLGPICADIRALP